MQVQIYRIDKDLECPKYETDGSFGFDFTAREETTIPPQEVGFIPSNTIIKCPKNLALLILPRSSTYRKKGLMFPHSIGLIDQDYCGPEDEILIQVINFGKAPIIIKRGERIAQGLFVQTQNVEFIEVEKEFLGKNSRGGFGSTGH